MTLIGWALGLLLGFLLGWMQIQLPVRWVQIVSGLGWLALAVTLIAVLTADSFTQGFGLVYLLLGAVLSLLAATPRLLLRGRRPGGTEPLWVSLGLGAALVAGALLAGLGADALLAVLVPPIPKAQVSFGLVPGLAVGTVLGLGWGWMQARRVPITRP